MGEKAPDHESEEQSSNVAPFWVCSCREPNVCVSFSSSWFLSWNWCPIWWGFWEATGSWLGRALEKGMHALIRDPRELSSCLCHVRITRRTLTDQRRSLTKTWWCWNPDLRLPASRIMRYNYLLFTSPPVWMVSLQQPKLRERLWGVGWTDLQILRP